MKRLKVERLQGTICYQLGLSDILWDGGTSISNKLAVLATFEQLVENFSPDIRVYTEGRALVFGNFSGLSLDGQIVLFAGEVRHNWLNSIRDVPKRRLTCYCFLMLQKQPKIKPVYFSSYFNIP